MSQIVLSDRSLELVARRFRYLGEPFRLRILQSLSHSEKTVTQIVEELGANQSNVSKHLQLLFEGGLVSRRKSGITANYSIANPGINALLELAYSNHRCEGQGGSRYAPFRLETSTTAIGHIDVPKILMRDRHHILLLDL